MSGKWQNQEVSNMLVTKWTCRENLRIHVSIVEAIEEIYCAMCPMKPYIECVLNRNWGQNECYRCVMLDCSIEGTYFMLFT